ncbi:MAG: response regulator, partial [Deltaproteobacteria bacterium]
MTMAELQMMPYRCTGDSFCSQAAAQSAPSAWRAIFESSPVAQQLVDLEGRLLAANSAWQTLWEEPERASLAHKLQDYNLFEHEALCEAGVGALVQRAGRGETVAAQSVALKLGGGGDNRSLRYLDVAVTPCSASANRQILLSFVDVTQQMRAVVEAAQLRSVIDHAPFLIFLKDTSHRFILANRETQRIFGFTDFAGQHDTDLFPGAEVGGLHAADNQVLHDGAVLRIEETLATPEGPRHFATTKFALRDKVNAVVGVAGITYDITDRVLAERENQRLQVSERAAREASKLKSEFLATMSHEIRTPLAGIIGLAGIVLEGQLSPAQRGYIKSLEGAAYTLLHILNDILDFSKLDARKFTLEAYCFDLRQLIGELSTALQPTVSKKGLQLLTHVDPAVPNYVVGDAARLRQILNNLINNAIKFSEHGSIRLEVTTSATAGVGQDLPLRFAVSDEGIGIRKQDIEKLFVPFSQTDGSIARRFGGTGLGLAISHALVTAMRGEMRVESTYGRGSTFWFTIVAQVATTVAPSQASGTQKALCRLQGRVLVAEDNAINQTIVLRLLDKMGLQADLARDGHEAVAAAARQAYDVILMDCQMPGMDGIEATQSIRRSSGSGSPVIVALTANAIKGERERCIAAGMNNYLTKPVTAQ